MGKKCSSKTETVYMSKGTSKVERNICKKTLLKLEKLFAKGTNVGGKGYIFKGTFAA